ncbi:MAG: hypothetical protein KBA55_01195 [Ruminococcus sp.]|nr:hypothetical protein [Ruminococcus sp.]
MDDKTTEKNSILCKLYGGIEMTWLKVILLAIGSAVLTAIFLIIPIFKDTSFERMGVHLEAWFFLAIFIMANCKKPLESAVKTFVFFLVSQPLIYLIQVPFSDMGFGLFGYYRYWFMMTLATFPMAFIGWFITKKNRLSVLILSPVLVFMSCTSFQNIRHFIQNPPRMLVTVLFCIMQIVFYVLAFFPDIKQKTVGILISVAAVAVYVFMTKQVNIDGAVFLPDDRIISDAAVIVMDDDSIADISIEGTGENSMIRVRASKYGTSDFTVRDGENEYRYTVKVYEDNGGHSQIEITEK